MAVQMPRAVVRPVPHAQCIVAEHNDLRAGLIFQGRARRLKREQRWQQLHGMAGTGAKLGVVGPEARQPMPVVAAGEDLQVTVQLLHFGFELGQALQGEVAQVIHEIIRTNRVVPQSDQGRIHLVDGRERALAVLDYPGVAKVVIGREEQARRMKRGHDSSIACATVGASTLCPMARQLRLQ